MAEHFKSHSAVLLIIPREISNGKQILLQRRQNTGYIDGKLDIPGGHVDEGETAVTAMIREAKEELGIDVAAEDLTFVHLQHRLAQHRTYYDIYFAATKYNGTPQVMEPEKCAELIWGDLSALPDDVIECRKDVLSRYAKSEFYSEWDERG